MKLPYCSRCNQPRTPEQLRRGICGACRRHRCEKHQPGSPACYSRHRCRCDPCCDASNRAKKGYRLRSPLVSVEMPRKHMERLIESGRPVAWIAGRLGVTATYVEYLLHTAKRLHPERALQIMELSIDIKAGLVDPAGTRRRIEALMVTGWPCSWMSERIGASGGLVSHIMTSQAVLATTAHRIAMLYDDLRDRPPTPTSRDEQGSVTRTRSLAERRRYIHPDRWDDGTGPHGIDNPQATPYTAKNSFRKATEMVEELRHIIDTDTPDSITQRLGYANLRSLVKTLYRLGEDELARHIDERRAA